MSLLDPAGFDAFATALPGVTLVDQWESRVAKVGGKVFTLRGTDGEGVAHVVFKCGEESFVILTAIDGIKQAPYFAKRQWVSVDATADLPASDLEAYVRRSYDVVAQGLTKKLRAELGIG